MSHKSKFWPLNDWWCRCVRVFARVLARVLVLVVGTSLVVESAFAGSAMMDESRRKKRMMRRSTEDDRKIIKVI